MEKNKKNVTFLLKRISELEAENAELRSSEQKLRMIIDAEYDGIIIHQNGKVFFNNRRVFDFTGINPETNTNPDPFLVFDYIHPDDKKLVINNFNKRICGAKVKPYIVRIISPDGKIWWIEVRGVAVTTDGKPATLNFLRNITRQVNAENQVRMLTRQLLQAQEAERQRISLDLHDTIVQDLAALRFKIDASIKMINSNKTDSVSHDLSFVANHLSRLVNTLRKLIWNLYPINLNDYGLVRALRIHCKEFSVKNKIIVDFDANGMNGLELEREKEINIFRIVQEALNNIAQHAEATMVKVRLLGISPDIIIRVYDDGKGFDKQAVFNKAIDRKQIGLRSIMERAKSFGGTAEIQSRPEHGTKIFITIPIE